MTDYKQLYLDYRTLAQKWEKTAFKAVSVAEEQSALRKSHEVTIANLRKQIGDLMDKIADMENN